MGLEAFITKHFGGSIYRLLVPKRLSQIEWLYRVNPTSPDSHPTAEEYRKVSPGSQPDYVRPIKDKLHNDRYFQRDTRRNYPKTLTFTQNELKLLSSQKA